MCCDKVIVIPQKKKSSRSCRNFLEYITRKVTNARRRTENERRKKSQSEIYATLQTLKYHMMQTQPMKL